MYTVLILCTYSINYQTLPLPLHMASLLVMFLNAQFQDAGLRVIIACRNEALAKQAAATLGCEYEILEAWIVTQRGGE